MIAQRNHPVFSRRPSVNPEFRLRRPAPPCGTKPTPAAPATRSLRAPRTQWPPRPTPRRPAPQPAPPRYPQNAQENTIARFLGGGLPWVHDDTPGTEATRVHESGAAAFGCPDRRSGRRVSANRHLQAAAPGKSPTGRFSFTSRRIDCPEKPLVQAG